jgi:hypothetical protein
MIDNVVLLITGTLHERDTHELLDRCHPLGVFDTMPALCVATNVEELYQSVLVETPLGQCSRRRYLYTEPMLRLNFQLLIFVTVFLQPISMTSTSKSFAIPYTKPILKTFIISVRHWVHRRPTSCTGSFLSKPIDEPLTSP